MIPAAPTAARTVREPCCQGVLAGVMILLGPFLGRLLPARQWLYMQTMQPATSEQQVRLGAMQIRNVASYAYDCSVCSCVILE